MLRRPVRIAVIVLFSTFLSVAVAQAAGPAANAVRPDGTKNRAAWMAQGSFGVMTHYLLSPKGSTAEERTADLNRTVDRFDLDYYIRQVQETVADWLIFTIGQTTGCLCSPNPSVDAKNPGHTPRRDIALEIAQRLKPLGKRLILYFPSEADADPCVKRALGFGSEGYAERYFEFLRQYSLKFGTLHHGWWFDLRRTSRRLLEQVAGGAAGRQPGGGRRLQPRRVLLRRERPAGLPAGRLSRR